MTFGHNGGYQGFFDTSGASTQLYLYGLTPYFDSAHINTANVVGMANFKLAGAVANIDWGIVLNGGTVATSAVAAAAGAATFVRFGYAVGSFNGWMFESMHLPRRMSNAELVTVTT
jgi:hypothetical protein